MKTLHRILAVLLVLGFVGLSVHYITNHKQKLQFEKIELKSKETQLIELNQKYDDVLKLQTKTEFEKQQQLDKIKQLETDRERLQRELQVKANKYLADSQKLNTAAQNVSGTVKAEGGKLEWLKASGIAERDWQYVDYIIQKESSWNPYARNASSGAGGLPQALPYSKTGCAWGDAVCQLRWANGYAINRYGSWEKAYYFWVSHKYW